MTHERPTRILVVEDEALIRMLACEMLLDAGFEVSEATDADSALQVLNDEPGIRAVFTDIDMPGGMDGVGLAAAIRAIAPAIACVVTSGKCGPALPEGAVFLPKPYGRRDLLAAIERVLDT